MNHNFHMLSCPGNITFGENSTGGFMRKYIVNAGEYSNLYFVANRLNKTASLIHLLCRYMELKWGSGGRHASCLRLLNNI
jgi:hypothetical protein